MARQRIDIFYRRLIATLTEEGLPLSQVMRRLEARARQDGRSDLPSERSVSRYMQGHKGLTLEERRQYKLLRWPDNLGDLPWEAGPAVLDLLRQLRQEGAGRPTVRLARWYWRLWQAVPDAPFGVRLSLSILHAALEELAEFIPDDWVRGIKEAWEWYLAYAPWRGEEAAKAYAKGILSGGLPNAGYATVQLLFTVRLQGVPGDVFDLLLEECVAPFQVVVKSMGEGTSLPFQETLDYIRREWPEGWRRIVGEAEETVGGFRMASMPDQKATSEGDERADNRDMTTLQEEQP